MNALGDQLLAGPRLARDEDGVATGRGGFDLLNDGDEPGAEDEPTELATDGTKEALDGAGAKMHGVPPGRVEQVTSLHRRRMSLRFKKGDVAPLQVLVRPCP